MKGVNVLSDGKSVMILLLKIREEEYEEIVEMGRNDDYTTSILLYYQYFS